MVARSQKLAKSKNGDFGPQNRNIGFFGGSSPLTIQITNIKEQNDWETLFITVFSRKNHLAVEFGNMRLHVLTAGNGNSQKNESSQIFDWK